MLRVVEGCGGLWRLLSVGGISWYLRLVSPPTPEDVTLALSWTLLG